jgi:hypothetical protein
MKKIIYSLVIMIAAGSLFTSCIEQVEPDGILALREAKARYYDALAQLRAKDGVYREAEAALKLAEAAVQQATADKIKAETDAFTKMEALNRELKQLEIDSMTMEMTLRAAEIQAEIDSIQKAMEIAAKDHEINLVNKQKELAEAEEALRVALRDIQLAAQDLTAAEKQAVIEAAAAYLMAREAVIDQNHKIFELETKLAQAQKELAEGALTWNEDEHDYTDAVEYYNAKIAQALADIADFEEAIKNIPNDVPGAEIEDALKAWQDEIDGYKATQQELDYALAGISKDKAALMVKYHDANAAYRSKLNSYLNANYPFLGDMTSNFGYPMDDPADLTEDDIPVDPEGNTEYTVHFGFEDEEGVLGEAGKEYKQGDKIGIPADGGELDKVLPDLEIKTTPAFTKFNALLDSYNGVTVDGTARTIIVDGMWNDVDADMKDFILGTKESTVGSQKLTRVDKDGKEYTAATADYGLWGAYYTLLRDKVLLEPVTTPIADLEKQLAAAKKVWEEHRAILKAGKSNYEPLKKAKEALKKAQETEGDQTKGIVAAINELQESLESVNSEDLSKNDSVRIINAFAAFAKAREEYLVYNKEKENAINFKYYRYGSSKKGGETIIDSVLFSSLNYDDLKKDKYGYLTTDADKRYCGDAEGFTPEPHQYALAHIARQLLNKTYADEIMKDPKNWKFSDFTGLEVNDIVGTPAHNAFYNEYEYVPKDVDPDHKDPHMITKPGGKIYESPALVAAKEAVKYATNDYENIYRQFWAEEYPADPNTKTVDNEAEINVEKYSYKTFTDPYNCVTFTGQEIDFTKAIGAILGTVDKAATDQNATNLDNSGAVSTSSVVFGKIKALKPTSKNAKGQEVVPDAAFKAKDFNSKEDDALKFDATRTDFYNYMVAEYRLWLAKNPADKDLDVIKKWIEDVEKAFDDANGKAAADAKAAYELDKAAYDYYVAYAEFSRDLWTEFAGSYTSSGVVKFRPKITNIKLEESGDYTLRIAYSGLTAQTDAPWSATSTGSSWNSNLKAKQLEFANEVMGDMPKDVAAHNAVYQKNRDEYAHAKIMIDAITPAYAAAAKVMNYQKYQELNEDGELVDKTVTGATVEELIAAYEQARKNYKEKLEGYIEDLDEDIHDYRDAIKDLEKGVPEAKVKIDELEAQIEKAKIELNALEEIAKGAKENLNRILEYVMSLDVNFVIPDFI